MELVKLSEEEGQKEVEELKNERVVTEKAAREEEEAIKSLFAGFKTRMVKARYSTTFHTPAFFCLYLTLK